MRKILFLLGVLFVLSSFVVGEGYDSVGFKNMESQWGPFRINYEEFFGDVVAKAVDLIPLVIFTGVGLFGVLILEYLGVDIVGWFLQIVTYFIDLVFGLLQWITSNEKQAIAAAILFLAFFAFVFFIL
jgi:hypothetical protein